MFRLSKKLASFNTHKTLIFVSEYDHFAKESTGLSTYSRLTLDELQDNFKSDFEKTVVLSIGKSKNEQIRIVQGGRRCVIPCIQKDNPFSLMRPLYYSLLLSKSKDMVIEFEFASYGGPLSVGAFIILLGLLKLFGKRVYFVIHQAVNRLEGLHEHLGLSKGSNKLRLLDSALNYFYKAVGIFSWKIIVLEQEIKNRIALHINPKKIIVIPHAVHKNRFVQKKNNVRKGRIDILIFGYIAWYKGLDRFIKAFNKLTDKRVHLTIAGGYSPAQRGKMHYETHYRSVLESAKKNPHITITGYVPESRVGTYYRKADICILPYRRFISSSGPLSQAFSFQKPVILSQELVPYMKSKDFREVMSVAAVKKEDLFYKITPHALKTLVLRIRKEKNYIEKLAYFSHDMALKRNWSQLIPEYRKTILTARNTQNLPSSLVKKHEPRSITKGYSYA